MKKVILNTVAAILTVFGLTGVAMISPAYADVLCANGTTADTIQGCPEWQNGEGISENSDLMSILTTVINVIVGAIGFIAVVMIVIGGISFATSPGDSGNVAKARNTILYGVVGLVVALLAFAIVNFVLSSVFTAK